MDRIERLAGQDRLIAATFLAAGAKGLTLPTLDAARSEFDLALCGSPRALTSERSELQEALGLG